MHSTTDILFQSPFIQVSNSGHVQRLFVSEFTPTSINPDTVSSKDVVVVPETGVSVRLFLPKRSAGNSDKRLPLLVYYHGGGFCLGSAFDHVYHSYVNTLAADANIIVVSVDYRLAPEHPVPTPFDDSWAALQWVASHGGGSVGDDEWLIQHADFNNVYLAGDSAGATIAHQMTIRAGIEQLNCGVQITGLLLVHPYFLGQELLESDSLDPESSNMLRATWMMVSRSTTGFEDPMINPMAGGLSALSAMACRRVMVSVAGMDVLKDRGKAYFVGLKRSGWEGEVELIESGGEEHVFHLFKPTIGKALELQRAICLFLNPRN